MARYSIKDLENFTKIKAHTLRIWEQRYQLLTPKRTETNIRYYSDKDLKKILNINLLYSNGLKISKIAELSEKEIFDKASELLHKDEHAPQNDVNRFIEYVLELNDKSIHQLLNDLEQKHGMEELFTDILIPLLEKIGTLWQVDAISVSHEHFLSNILREFMIVKVLDLKFKTKAKAKVVLFLKEEEKHELSLLFYYYLLKKRGYDCYYLGQTVPMKDLRTFVEEVKPDYLFTSLIAELSESNLKAFFKSLGEFFDLNNLFIGGVQLTKYQKSIPKSVHQIQKLEDIIL
ncbi:MAG: MerR family transcriptional regulator [Crocinitomicaceae bacterium]|nr:MerR family transcriptional regulator [Crocinitomicaceae bacterium]